VKLVRRQKIGVFFAVAIAALVGLGWLASLSTSTTPPPSIEIVSTTNLEVSSGLSNAVVFPFQLAPDQQPGEEGTPTIGSASASINLTVSGCASVDAGGCPGVSVAIYTGDAVGGAGSGGNVSPVWCAGMTGASCGTVMQGNYQVDLTAFAGQALDLVLWTPSGTEWVDISSSGSWGG
jgi:hypothetical protein